MPDSLLRLTHILRVLRSNSHQSTWSSCAIHMRRSRDESWQYLVLDKIHLPEWVTLGLCGSSQSARDAADYAGVYSGADPTPVLVCGVLAISTSANEIPAQDDDKPGSLSASSVRAALSCRHAEPCTVAVSTGPQTDCIPHALIAVGQSKRAQAVCKSLARAAPAPRPGL